MADVARAVKHPPAPPRPALPDMPTVKDFAEAWTSGELHRRYPDHVKSKRSAGDDKTIFDKYVLPYCADKPIASFKLDDAERIMARLPVKLSSARRRNIAVSLHRLLAIAVYPARLLASNPLPKGFLPPARNAKASAYLYPEEDAALMACDAGKVPLARRLQ